MLTNSKGKWMRSIQTELFVPAFWYRNKRRIMCNRQTESERAQARMHGPISSPSSKVAKKCLYAISVYRWDKSLGNFKCNCRNVDSFDTANWFFFLFFFSKCGNGRIVVEWFLCRVHNAYVNHRFMRTTYSSSMLVSILNVFADDCFGLSDFRNVAQWGRVSLSKFFFERVVIRCKLHRRNKINVENERTIYAPTGKITKVFYWTKKNTGFKKQSNYGNYGQSVNW